MCTLYPGYLDHGDGVLLNNNEIYFFVFQTFAFDHCFWSLDENIPKFASEYGISTYIHSTCYIEYEHIHSKVYFAFKV